MSIFQGLACFSPEVPQRVQNTWVTHGGMVTTSPKQGTGVRYMFCNGQSDSWAQSLVRKAIPVFDANWVVDAATANFCIPISPYLLNDSQIYKTSAVAANGAPKTPIRQSKGRPEEPPALLPVKRPFQLQDEPESAERPRKRARIMESQITLKDFGISTTSRVKFVDDVPVASASHLQQKEIPHIDLSQVQCKSRQSSLNIQVVRKSQSMPNLAPSKRQVLVFEEDSTLISRISFSVALETLQHIQADDCALFTPGALYNGQEFLATLAI